MKKFVFASLVVATVTGCHGSPFMIPTQHSTVVANHDYRELGRTEGESTGFIFLGFIPMGKNDMLQRAYLEALEEKNADMILQPEVDERWLWTPIGNFFKTKVTGEAIRIDKR